MNNFPNLTDLQFCDDQYEVDEEPAPSLSRPLRGKLVLKRLWNEELGMVGPLKEPRPEIDELVLSLVPIPLVCDCLFGTQGGMSSSPRLRTYVIMGLLTFD